MLLHTILLLSNKLFSRITETTNVNVEKDSENIIPKTIAHIKHYKPGVVK